MPIPAAPAVVFSHGIVHLRKDSLPEAGLTTWPAPLPGTTPYVREGQPFRTGAVDKLQHRSPGMIMLFAPGLGARRPRPGTSGGRRRCGSPSCCWGTGVPGRVAADSTEKALDPGAIKVSPTGDGVNRGGRASARHRSGHRRRGASAGGALASSNPRSVLPAIELSRASHRKMPRNPWWTAGSNSCLCTTGDRYPDSSRVRPPDERRRDPDCPRSP